jgi:hypothetical protein
VSAFSEACRVQILITDHGVADSASKINMLGAGFQVAGLQPNGFIAPQSVVVIIEGPSDHFGEQYAFELALYDSGGQLVETPALTGEKNPLRIAQALTADAPSVAGVSKHALSLWSHQQFIATFPGGMPLAAGQTYEWRVGIDGDQRPNWRASFFVPGPQPPTVLG